MTHAAATIEPDEATLSRGERVDAYTIVGLIGTGGFGEVYEAESGNGERVALKCIRLHRRRDRRAAMRATLEAAVLKSCRHGNVVRYHDSGVTPDGLMWIAMELLEGKSFRRLIHEEAPLDIERALRLGRQVCRGIAALHALDAVHRDIKPENVFLTGEADVVKVLDFGLVKHNGVTVQTSRPIGTALYMAPDQLTHKGPGADPRWDVYATGIVIYELLLGRHPFARSNGALPFAPAEIIAMQLMRDIEPLSGLLPGCPADVSACVARALAKDPAERFQTIVELAKALSACRTAYKERRSETPIAAGAPVEAAGRARPELAEDQVAAGTAPGRRTRAGTLRMAHPELATAERLAADAATVPLESGPAERGQQARVPLAREPPRLRVLTGPSRGREHVLRWVHSTVGADPSCDFPIDDPGLAPGDVFVISQLGEQMLALDAHELADLSVNDQLASVHELIDQSVIRLRSVAIAYHDPVDRQRWEQQRDEAWVDDDAARAVPPPVRAPSPRPAPVAGSPPPAPVQATPTPAPVQATPTPAPARAAPLRGTPVGAVRRRRRGLRGWFTQLSDRDAWIIAAVAGLAVLALVVYSRLR